MRTLYILTASQMSGFLCGHLASMRASGFKPVLCVPEATDAVVKLAAAEGVPITICPMHREISPLGDFLSYIRLVRLILKLKPDMTVTIGPKAGLIGGLASATCQVTCRIQTKWGIRLETTHGLLRLLLTQADKVASACAHLVLCDSKSVRLRAIELGLVEAEKIQVVASGSANGIDIRRFELTPTNLANAQDFRRRIGAGTDAQVIGFVGRVSKDKGLNELVAAWPLIRAAQQGAILAIIGDDECVTQAEQAQLARLRRMDGVHMLGQQSRLEGIFPAFDVFLLPSHREGFGVVVLEAGVLGVPTVGFKVTGMKDSVVSGETGELVELGDVMSLAAATLRYLADKELRVRHGTAARLRVHAHFRQEIVWAGYFRTFKSIADSKGLDTGHLAWPGPA
jgi:glycosyltransferase involved in cell wall biosynthesis